MVGNRHAFSLVELSIVLVILGLLVGGILAGQSLIRAAELRSISTDIQKIRTATNAFRDRYFSLPGDFNLATNVWTSAGASCLASNVSPAVGGTCNGNNNGEIFYTSESWLFWEHLGLAGLLEGQYAGGDQSVPYGRVLVAGVNAFKTRLPNVAIQPGHALVYDITTNYLYIGSDQYDNNILVFPAMKTEEAWNLDTKMDDGKATYGAFLAGNAFNGTSYPQWCVSNWKFTGSAQGSGDYTNFNNALGTGCLLAYKL